MLNNPELMRQVGGERISYMFTVNLTLCYMFIVAMLYTL